MASPAPPHVVIFPFMAQGHTLPLLDLSKALSRRTIRVTIITTPSNASSILHYISKHPLIHLIQIPFPVVHGLPKGCENTAHLSSMDLYLPFLQATKQLQEPFHRVLHQMSQDGTLPICVISDFFLGWTLATCRVFSIPRLVFHGMGVLSMAISKTIWEHAPHLITESDSEPLNMPGLQLPFKLTRADLSEMLGVPDHDDPLSQFISEVAGSDVESWGVVVNSCFELERSHIAAFESFYGNGAKAWCVGPLMLYDKMEGSESSDMSIDQQQSARCIKWLTEQATPASVIYVAFGTQADVCDAQLDEVAFGLEMSGYSFIWLVRSMTWCPPQGMEERLKVIRGLIIRDWVDQKCILEHRATGGFLSHCGWNSVLESISMGVPILAWPMIAEQSLNAKLVVEGLGAGLSVAVSPGSGPGIAVGRKAICEGVRDLMGKENGRSARERAQALGRVARRAVQEGGSSYESLSELIGRLGACGQQK